MCGGALYGRTLGALLRQAGSPLLTTQASAPVVIAAIDCGSRDAERTAVTPPSDDGYLLLTRLDEAQTGTFGTPARAATTCAEGSFWIHDLRAAEPLPLAPGRRMIAFYLSRDAIDGLADQAGVSRIAALRSSSAAGSDPVATHIAAMLLPHFEAEGRNATFADNMLLALGIHVLRTYGQAVDGRPVKAGGLAPWQEERAKAFMIERLDEELSIDRVAEACGLSSSRFSRAFRIATGRPPYRWFLEQRIERSKTLMADATVGLPEIALASGFGDQSQFTVAFGRIVGMSPGAWRRQLQAAR